MVYVEYNEYQQEEDMPPWKEATGLFLKLMTKKPKKTISITIILNDGIEKPTSLLDLSRGMDKHSKSLLKGS